MQPTVIVVAGLDPSGGAGLLADADAIRDAGARPLLCASALTIQTTRAVRGWHPVPPEVVAAQVLALAEEEGPIGAVKLGMLGAAALARELATLRSHPSLRDAAWVIDPVIRSSSGAELIEGGAATYAALIEDAFVTPNLAEAAALTGGEIAASEEEMARAAEVLLARGARAVLVKGGHLDGEPLDLLVTRAERVALRGRRRPGTKRGTGCRLASWLAGGLARGLSPVEAAAGAKRFVASYLDTAWAPLPAGAEARSMARK